jgi:hypothetical protein
MRNVVEKDDPKFIFFGSLDPAKVRRRTIEEVREAARQHAEGVEVTNEQALKILTSPYAPAGFYDLTDKNPQPATQGDAQVVAPAAVGANALLTPVDAVVYDEPVPIDSHDLTPAATQPDEPKDVKPKK